MTSFLQNLTAKYSKSDRETIEDMRHYHSSPNRPLRYVSFEREVDNYQKNGSSSRAAKSIYSNHKLNNSADALAAYTREFDLRLKEHRNPPRPPSERPVGEPIACFNDWDSAPASGPAPASDVVEHFKSKYAIPDAVELGSLTSPISHAFYDPTDADRRPVVIVGRDVYNDRGQKTASADNSGSSFARGDIVEYRGFNSTNHPMTRAGVNLFNENLLVANKFIERVVNELPDIVKALKADEKPAALLNARGDIMEKPAILIEQCPMHTSHKKGDTIDESVDECPKQSLLHNLAAKEFIDKDANQLKEFFKDRPLTPEPEAEALEAPLPSLNDEGIKRYLLPPLDEPLDFNTASAKIADVASTAGLNSCRSSPYFGPAKYIMDLCGVIASSEGGYHRFQMSENDLTLLKREANRVIQKNPKAMQEILDYYKERSGGDGPVSKTIEQGYS